MVVATAVGRYDEFMAAASAYRMVPDPGDELLAYGKHIGYRRGRRLGLAKGRAEGLEQVRSTLLDIVEARPIKLRPEDRSRIQTESSLERLLVWIRRAATARSARAIFSD